MNDLTRHIIQRDGCHYEMYDAADVDSLLARQWQPIETAPKTGQRIRLWMKAVPGRNIAREVHGRFYSGLTHSDWINDAGDLVSRNVTHWMPVASPPSAGQSVATPPASED